jgi:hypothetical protein
MSKKKEKILVDYVTTYCDICGKKIGEHASGICHVCRRDLCDDCIEIEIDDHHEGNCQFCTGCWVISKPFIEQMRQNEEANRLLYIEWKQKCKSMVINENV